MTRRLAALVLFTFGAACSRCGAPAVVDAGQPIAIGNVLRVQGPVSVTRVPTAARPLQVEAVFEGDEVITGVAGTALVGFGHGRELELKENGVYHFARGAAPKQGSLELDDISIVEGPDAELDIVTRSGRSKLGQQTKAAVGAGGRFTLEVIVGEITQVSDDGGVLVAKAGDRLQLTLSGVEIVSAEPAVVDAGAPARVQLTLMGVELIAEVGTLDVKPATGAGFRLTGKEAKALEAGSSLKVQAKSRARMTTRGASLRLLSGSLGALKRAEEGDTGQLDVSLERGVAQVQFDTKEKATQVTVNELVLTPDSAHATVEVTKTAKGSTVQVRAGAVQLKTGAGAATTLHAHDVVVVNGAEVTTTPAGKPAVVLPIERRVRVFVDQAPPPLALELPANATSVIVSEDAAFTTTLLDGPATEWVELPALSGNEVHWRASADDGSVVGTGHARLLPDRSETLDERQRGDTITETGQKATVVFQETVPTLTFNYEPTPFAVTYRLEVYRADQLAKPVFTADAKMPTHTVTSGTLGEGSYVWRAAPLDANGTTLTAGRMNKMDIVYDNSRDTLAITAPKNGTPRSASTVATGVAPVGAKLFVNRALVTTDEKGRFSTPIGVSTPTVFRCVSASGDDFWFRR